MPLLEQVFIIASEADLGRVLCCVKHVRVYSENSVLDHPVVVDLVKQASFMRVLIAVAWSQTKVAVTKCVKVRLSSLYSKHDKVLGAGLCESSEAGVHSPIEAFDFGIIQVHHKEILERLLC